eukprot:c241_g1_i1.p1 GENE.c241_g1_i1~~c241_g1_i1.p1  ORF type:complete len:333 (-),score=51.18 c241_g1_i1:41-1039(-)
MAADAEMAKANWEMENEVDQLNEFDSQFTLSDESQEILKTKPWKKDPHYFKNCRISSIALLKMVTHARSGGSIEVMGMLQGLVREHTLIVTDVFALPVEGTETRVNALGEANEYMVNYAILSKNVGRPENVIGWYHSHPGYGCWLSGIDCNTQMVNQQYQDPFLAIVVDPVRTMSAGKVEIGAFRTYPKDHKPTDHQSQYQSIPLDKIDDFGVHCKQYYALETTTFKSPLDSHLLNLLWDKYWINTLSSSPVVNNRRYTMGVIADLAQKIDAAEAQLTTSRIAAGIALDKDREESKLSKLRKDCSTVAVQCLQGLMTDVIKDSLFNKAHTPC